MQYDTKQKRLIVLKTFLSEMVENGFHFRVHDFENNTTGSNRDVKKAIGLSQDNNEDVIHVFLRGENLDKVSNAARQLYSKYREENPDKVSTKLGVVQLVYGDKGEDVAANYNVDLEQFMTKTIGVIGTLAMGDYVHTTNNTQKNPSI